MNVPGRTHLLSMILTLTVCTSGCSGEPRTPPERTPRTKRDCPYVRETVEGQSRTEGQSLLKVVHVFVALCDNKHQGIVKVPATLGNGQDPKNNLYWGARYGVDAFFARSPHWRRVRIDKADRRPEIIARAAFVGTAGATPVYVVMSAYDGRQGDCPCVRDCPRC